MPRAEPPKPAMSVAAAKKLLIDCDFIPGTTRTKNRTHHPRRDEIKVACNALKAHGVQATAIPEIKAAVHKKAVAK